MTATNETVAAYAISRPSVYEVVITGHLNALDTIDALMRRLRQAPAAGCSWQSDCGCAVCQPDGLEVCCCPWRCSDRRPCTAQRADTGLPMPTVAGDCCYPQDCPAGRRCVALRKDTPNQALCADTKPAPTRTASGAHCRRRTWANLALLLWF